MTNLEAIRVLDEELAGLRLMDEEGRDMPPDIVMGFIAHSIGDEWDQLVEGFCLWQISPEDYVGRARKLVRRFLALRLLHDVEGVIK